MKQVCEQELNLHIKEDMSETIEMNSSFQNKKEEKKNKEATPVILFVLFSYLYFVQGAIMGISATMPYIYPELPDVHTMTLFNSVTLPYSLKFLLAPFLQRHTSIEYGKRKTWIIISQLLTGFTLFIGSFYTQMQYAQLFGVLCILMMVGMVLQNIALHSLIVKEITNAHESSMIQSWSEVFGILVGALILLKFTSRDFAESIGLTEPISSPQVVITIFCVVILIPLFIIHLKFEQRVLESERRGSRFSFCQILSYYKIFTKPGTKYFRFCVLVITYNQGINFFNSLYDYQLVKAGFSRDTMNTIQNINIVPIIALTFYFSKWTTMMGGHYPSIALTTFLTVLICIYIIAVFPLNPWVFGVLTFFISLLDAWRFFIFGVIINEFPLHALSGMYITLLGSFYNFGRLVSIHTELCGLFGWKLMSAVGMVLQLTLLIFLKRMFEWMQAGDVKVAKQIEQPSEEFNARQLEEVEFGFR